MHRLEIDNSRDDLLLLVAFVLLAQSSRLDNFLLLLLSCVCDGDGLPVVFFFILILEG